MSIVTVKDEKRIVSLRDEKRVITLPSGKIKDINVVSGIILIPRSTRDYSNISKTIDELNRQLLVMDERNIDLEGQLSGNILKEIIKHKDITLKGYTIHCLVVQDDILIMMCSSLRKQNKCMRECSRLKDFIRKIS